MRIVVEDLPEETLRLAGAAKVSLDGPGCEDVTITGPVDYRLDLTARGTTVEIEGRVEADVASPCSRCARPLSLRVERSFRDVFAPANEREGVLPRELDEDDLDLDYYQGVSIDGLQVIAEQVLLGLPMKILCDENCSGLCATCGADRNETECDCEPPADPRWAALGELRDRF